MIRRRVLTFGLVLVGTALLAPAAEAASFGSRTLRQGTSGSDVKTLQRYLDRIGQETTVDGIFGRGTARSVRGFESEAGRKVDGVVTRSDARALKSEVKSSSTPTPTVPQPVTGKATLTEDGLAVPPADAPDQVKAIIEAGNEIATAPYKYGGGHGKWNDTGYDCSGSVSYALHGAGLLRRALDSGEFMSWGEHGRGTWVTIRANPGHAYMIVAGLRFDTSARRAGTTRWTDEMRSAHGYRGVHPAGL
jgi:peptidoglycan hydrolase-like protein with peptidoglycan-binding domain